MVKMTIAGVDYEGSPQELKELLDLLGAKFMAENELVEPSYRKISRRKPKVGDFIKFNADKYYEIKVRPLDGTQTGYTDSENLVKATDEEVAQVKAEERWEKIGRKPGEFKKGDIVRLLEDSGANEKGELVEIAVDGAIMYYNAVGDKYGSNPSWFELIAPVESRFDLS